ncbi:MAG: BatD family protein [Muribaculaceae bacterium]|nr:BatD family protein [Muribaculaceae bacterium]
MKKRFTILLSLLLAAVTMTLSAAEFTVIPPRTVIAGQRFTVTYRLKNADSDGTALKVPEIDGCKLLYGPATSTMKSYQIINGRQSSSTTVDYTYTYLAEKEGTYTIEPASINADGKTMRSSTASFKVLPPDVTTQSGNRQTDRQSPASSEVRDVTQKDVFIRILLNKKQVYEQEAVECTMKLYTKLNVNNISAQSPPTFDGFLIEDVDLPANINDTEHIDGQNYMTAVLRKYIIFPQKSGKLTINSGKYDIEVVQYETVHMGYFPTRRPVVKTVHVAPGNLEINVNRLPDGAPAGFTGAVGNYALKTDISTESLRTNEAATLTVTVKGSGNIKYLKEPVVDFPTEFEQYTPKQDINVHVAGNNVAGSNITEYTFVPQSVGDFNIPPVTFVYFNPSSGKYETLTSGGYHVKVAKGVNSVSTTTAQQDITAKNNDILHIKTGDKSQSKNHEPVIHSPIYWIFYILLIILLATSIFLYSKHVKFNADVTGVKKARANKVAKRRLKDAERAMKLHQTDKFYAELLQALWGYLSDKLSIPASQLTRQNIQQNLTDYHTPQSLIDRVIALLDECEMARFTPDITNESVETTYREVSDVINEMENMKK